ncbi:MAG TPA: hypothetical protein H9881_15680 [Candidatus Stackebrandtia excrementipullorum]|nr:hypothetical protein [Candidatus Stackebrandtia excrementipullorum]
MEYRGNDVHADMDILWQAGQTHFPNTAISYSEAASTLNSVSGSSGSGVMNQWHNVKDYLQQRVARSAEALEDTGTALRQVAIDLAETDGEAATALNASMEEYGEEPAEVPDAPLPENIQGPTEGSWD